MEGWVGRDARPFRVGGYSEPRVPKAQQGEAERAVRFPAEGTSYTFYRGTGRAILLGRPHGSHKILQRSIEKTIEKSNYDWLTLRIRDNGKIGEG